jgi:DNA polymerase-1
MMLRGIGRNATQTTLLKQTLSHQIKQREEWLRSVIPTMPDRWWASPTKLKALCYDLFEVKPVLNRKTHLPAVDKVTMTTIGKREPILKPILQEVLEVRSLQNALQVVELPTDPVTGRWYTNFTVAGTITFRFTSSKNPFGFGSNLQNITSGKELSEGVRTPNLRKMFSPDPGYVLFDVDLERADAQFVAWDSQDTTLMDIFTRAKTDHSIDIHTENARSIFGDPVTKANRNLAKAYVHATNYGAHAGTIASLINITKVQAQQHIDKWFFAHPAIAEWHRSTNRKLQTTRTINNIFGYRCIWFDRLEGVLPEALAWQGQSGTAIVCAKAMLALDKLPYIHLNLQVHDSIVFQIRKEDYPDKLLEIRAALEISAPYPNSPLIIPWSAKASTHTWGDCIPVPWDNPPPIETL